MDEAERKLIGNPDAQDWAFEFMRLIEKKPGIASDPETMIAWFSAAINTGYDYALKHKAKQLQTQLGNIEVAMREAGKYMWLVPMSCAVDGGPVNFNCARACAGCWRSERRTNIVVWRDKHWELMPDGKFCEGGF